MPIDTNVLETVRPSRRSVVRGAAWSVPVVSVAATAPAFATSLCQDGNYQIRWASDYNATSRVATANRISTSGSGATGSAPLTLTVTSKFNGTMAAGSTGSYSNLATSPGNVGGLGVRGLTIMQRSTQTALATPRANQNQVVTLTFNRPVWNLKFTLTDIDSQLGQYQDRVYVSGAPAFTLASQVGGSGTSGSPWAPTGTNITQDPVTGGGGNVAVDYTNKPAASVYTLTYWNNQSGNLSGNGLQGVFISTMTFSSETC
ncbi:hypothetical protein Q9S36_24870 [Microbacterium sp. ARD31]|uniref:hypothetical protein n=1 Tax=Microbacterium sp. ARD31 TaxID=2962576 RepID=UPI002880D3B9|nr:hypothetical protein [Microbacterium sp. ARD31]MDT0183426.1 hypothetical protein [Microbacterium sp. ARD31]